MGASVVTIAAMLYLIAADEPVPPVGPATKWDACMDKLQLLALNQAFIKGMQNLFFVWLREPHPELSHPRAGANKLRRMYAHSRDMIDQREKAREARGEPKCEDLPLPFSP